MFLLRDPLAYCAILIGLAWALIVTYLIPTPIPRVALAAGGTAIVTYVLLSAVRGVIAWLLRMRSPRSRRG